MAKVIEVSAGILYKESHILIAKRQNHAEGAGLWEFPGGKLEQGESPIEALKRELKEELDIIIDLNACALMKTIEYQYPEKQVKLYFWKVFKFEGEPSGIEKQEIAWVLPQELKSYVFLEANASIVDALCRESINHR